MATREDPVITLNDGPSRLPKELRATAAEFTADEQARLRAGKLGKFSQIIDRNRPIEVIRGELPNAPREMVAPPPARAEAPMNPMRHDAMDDLMTARGVITVGQPAVAERQVRPPTPANAVVIPYSEAVLKKAGITAPPAQPAPAPNAPLPPVHMATAQVVPQPPAAPPTQVVVPVTGAVVPVVQQTKRETVTLSSPTIGKHRLKVAQVLVSSSVVVLVYEDNDEATIYEPPAGGPEQTPLLVEHGDQRYDCAYLGQSVSQPVLGQPGRQLLLVVLVRL